MSEILTQLEVNETFFIQFVLFGVFFFVLSAIYLKPFQRILEQRSHKLKNELQGSRELLQAVENRLADYERVLATARAQAMRDFEKRISDVRAKEETAINAVKDEIKKDFQGATQQLQAEKQKIEAELKAQTAGIADTLAASILGK